MKISKILFGLALTTLLFSCSKDDNTDSALTSNEARTSAEIDNYNQFVDEIAENQIAIAMADGGKATSVPESFLPPCATVTVTGTPQAWVRTIDFGTGCTLPNGNVLQGIIIISRTVSNDPMVRTYSVTFSNFSINNRQIAGNKTIVRTISQTPPIQPTSTVTMNITVTFPNGAVFNRTGVRTSTMIQGFGTPMWMDNIFRVTGNWTTTTPNWTQTTTVTTPLIIRMNCQYKLVSGVIQIVRNDNMATIDYGDGECDNIATLTLNGNTTTITFGN